jgi:methyltransferase (TIGR00027 family)
MSVIAPIRTDDEMIGSASVTAMMRYLLSNEEGLSQNPDYLGKHFVVGKWRRYLENPKKSIEELQLKLPGCIYYHLIRTKFFDDCLKSWLNNEQNSQVIILGSGFDSRSIRFKKELNDKNVMIYEVDLPAMLIHKNNVVRQEIDSSLHHIKYVPCNFNTDNLVDKLEEGGIDLSKPTFIIWEGVTFFLTPETVASTLIMLHEHFSGRLLISFDYAFRNYVEGNLKYYGAKELHDVLIELGEPHLFGINYDEISGYFSKLGYETKTNYTSFMLEALYLMNTFGESVGKPHAFHGMAVIEKL